MSAQAFECSECGHMVVSGQRCHNCMSQMNKKSDYPYGTPAKEKTTDVEQLRKELNELRERVAVLEAQPHNKWVPVKDPMMPPYKVTCDTMRTHTGPYLPGGNPRSTV